MLHQLLSVFDLLESFDLGVSVETRLPQCYQTKGVLCAVQEREDTPLVTEPPSAREQSEQQKIWWITYS